MDSCLLAKSQNCRNRFRLHINYASPHRRLTAICRRHLPSYAQDGWSGKKRKNPGSDDKISTYPLNPTQRLYQRGRPFVKEKRRIFHRQEPLLGSVYSAAAIVLKELWTLKWHREYDTTGPWTEFGGVTHDNWPEWMRSRTTNSRPHPSRRMSSHCYDVPRSV